MTLQAVLEVLASSYLGIEQGRCELLFIIAIRIDVMGYHTPAIVGSNWPNYADVPCEDDIGGGG